MNRASFIFALLVVALLIFSLYRAKYNARETAEAFSAIEASIASEERRHLELLAEFSHLSRQEKIEEYARNELGMVPARTDQFVMMEQFSGDVTRLAMDGGGGDGG